MLRWRRNSAARGMSVWLIRQARAGSLVDTKWSVEARSDESGKGKRSTLARECGDWLPSDVPRRDDGAVGAGCLVKAGVVAPPAALLVTPAGIGLAAAGVERGSLSASIPDDSWCFEGSWAVGSCIASPTVRAADIMWLQQTQPDKSRQPCLDAGGPLLIILYRGDVTDDASRVQCLFDS